MKQIRIGTRGSQLALWQANFIKAELEKITDIPVSLIIIKTQGDKITHLSFDKMEGKGFFTKEIEDALLRDEIDLAVHSLKDLQTTMPEGLALTAVGYREDHREVVLIRKESSDSSLPLGVRRGGIIGSSSVRRQCQIFQMRDDLELKDLRGNVPTRINKLRDGHYDAIILAHAGLKRLALDVSDLDVHILEAEQFLPAPGQGILGIQTRAADAAVNDIVSRLDDPEARLQTLLERGLLARFEGGCQLPLGAYSRVSDAGMELHAVFGIRREGRWERLMRAQVRGDSPEGMIEDVYAHLTETPTNTA